MPAAWARRLICAALMSCPVAAQSQLSELHFGGLVSYATGNAFQEGVGATVSYAPARLAYMGVRWVYYFGSTEQGIDATGTFSATNRTQLFAADLGLQYPVGPVELMAGMTIGAVRFAQTILPGAATSGASTTGISTEFMIGPTVLAQIRAGPIMVIPQVAYLFAGSPDLPWPVDHSGLALSLLIVVPIERDRIRY